MVTLGVGTGREQGKMQRHCAGQWMIAYTSHFIIVCDSMQPFCKYVHLTLLNLTFLRPTVKRGMDCGMESFRGIIKKGVASCRANNHGCGFCRAGLASRVCARTPIYFFRWHHCTSHQCSSVGLHDVHTLFVTCHIRSHTHDYWFYRKPHPF